MVEGIRLRRSQAFGHFTMTDYTIVPSQLKLRDTVVDERLRTLENNESMVGDHLDRLYEKYHDLWDAVEKLSEGIAQNVPLPLKYK